MCVCVYVSLNHLPPGSSFAMGGGMGCVHAVTLHFTGGFGLQDGLPVM